MSIKIVGIGEYHVSSGTEEQIKTIALGSCIAVCIYDYSQKIGGIIHSALPHSQINPEKAVKEPGYFVDTGLPLLINTMKKHGANPLNFHIKLAGGAKMMKSNGMFDIGKRNVLAVKKYLWNHKLGIIKEDTGGTRSRTVTMYVSTGELFISSGKTVWQL